MEKETLGLFGTLGGVVLGFLLSQAAEWTKSRRSKRKIRKAVSLLISMEIKKNYRLLMVYWIQVEKLVESSGKEDEKDIPLSAYGRAISETPFPLLSDSAWERHLDKLFETFSFDQITHIWDFYENLAQLAKLHEAIAHLRETADIKGATAPLWLRGTLFQRSSENPTKDFKMIIGGILKYQMDRIFPG